MMAKEDPITIEKIKEEPKDQNEIVTNDN